MHTGDAASAARSDGWGSGQGACMWAAGRVRDTDGRYYSLRSVSILALCSRFERLPYFRPSVEGRLRVPELIALRLELPHGHWRLGAPHRRFPAEKLVPGAWGCPFAYTRTPHTVSSFSWPGCARKAWAAHAAQGGVRGGRRGRAGTIRCSSPSGAARPRPRSPAAALALCASAASSLTDGLKQHAPMAPAEPHAAGAAARGRAPTVCWGAVARLPLKPGALPPPSQAPAAPTFGLFALEAPGGLRPSPLQQEATKKALADSSADGGDAAGRSQQLCKQPLALAASHPGCCRLQQ